jgi:hypothetical protein
VAAAASIAITGEVTDLPSGSKTIGPITQTSAAAVGDQTVVELASGFNEITVPADASGVIITFDSTSAVTKTLKGVTGDTGIALDPNGTTYLTFPGTPPASFGVTAGSADTGLFTTFLFY